MHTLHTLARSEVNNALHTARPRAKVWGWHRLCIRWHRRTGSQGIRAEKHCCAIWPDFRRRLACTGLCASMCVRVCVRCCCASRLMCVYRVRHLCSHRSVSCTNEGYQTLASPKKRQIPPLSLFLSLFSTVFSLTTLPHKVYEIQVRLAVWPVVEIMSLKIYVHTHICMCVYVCDYV